MAGRPRNVVIENAYRDLEYHNEFFTRMGMGKDSVMIIHVRIFPCRASFPQRTDVQSP